jgi:hypothetical protein
VLKKVGIPPDVAAAFMAATAADPRVPRVKDGTFVKLPYESARIIAGRRDASMAVLIELAHLRFRRRESVVPLGNAALQSVGVSHDAKVRALRRLEADGLVAVDWRGGKKTPHVRLLWTA